jgi:5-methylcytosine-specific restriction endonuclease McrA
MPLRAINNIQKQLFGQFKVPQSLISDCKKALFLISEMGKKFPDQDCQGFISSQIAERVLKPVNCRELIYNSFPVLRPYSTQELSYQVKYLNRYSVSKLKQFTVHNHVDVSDKRCISSYIEGIRQWILNHEAKNKDKEQLIKTIYELKEYLKEHPIKEKYVPKTWKYLICAIDNPCYRTNNPDFDFDNSLFIEDTNYKSFLRSQYWQFVRLKVLDRDNCQCSKCGNTSMLEVHHKSYEHHGDELNYLGDLITLCKWCHQKEHKK